MEDQEENYRTPDPYKFEFQCEGCGHVWIVNTRDIPFEERAGFLDNQICPKCDGVDVGETEDSVNDWG